MSREGRGRAPLRDHEIEVSVEVLNVTYVFRGMDAIKDLMDFCNEQSSDVFSTRMTADVADPPDLAVPA